MGSAEESLPQPQFSTWSQILLSSRPHTQACNCHNGKQHRCCCDSIIITGLVHIHNYLVFAAVCVPNLICSILITFQQYQSQRFPFVSYLVHRLFVSVLLGWWAINDHFLLLPFPFPLLPQYFHFFTSCTQGISTPFRSLGYAWNWETACTSNITIAYLCALDTSHAGK